ncbi:AAA family ATPase [Pannonibacter carbonis]|uniref:bifunctional aminoglycoside phosphotransferase/ATP-binding protein n=1 Tax=Pannonibacter carbonis TaxID=2067569 RepID=UPI000D0F60ED|nr:bifunctional aminoglycoside phosphotransferase/ATP-binding protein [Pannonibacter carbonis]
MQTGQSSAIQAMFQGEALAVLDKIVARTPDACRIDTHANIIFLIGPDAYKMKRAVRFPFLDYSTLELRRTAVAAELTRNRLFAPDLYLGEASITREADGSLVVNGDGTLVEPLVHMRRFDETATLDRLADTGPFSDALMDALAAALATAHANASCRDADAWLADLAAYVTQNEVAFHAAPELFVAAQVDALTVAARSALKRISPLVRSRGRQGLVRLAHGDAHLANVALIDEQPVLFDAVEFDEAIATGDVLYDLAFTLMDLVERGQMRPACHLLNRYLDLSAWQGGEEGLAALPFYLSLRAAIRAKIAAASIGMQHDDAVAQNQRGAALAYFDLAQKALEPAMPRLIAVGGLSGSGKSTLAHALAPDLMPLPGARVLRSDVERKRRLGLRETEPAPAAAYTQAASDTVYAALLQKARAALAAGHSVILDAVYAKPEERAAVAALANAMELPFTGFWLEADPAVLKARVTARKGDASDATAEIVARQLSYDLGPMDWVVLPGGADKATTLAAARAAMQQL